MIGYFFKNCKIWKRLSGSFCYNKNINSSGGEKMEKMLQLLILVPYFYFFSWQRKVQLGSKHFSFLYYFYWFYLPLLALFSLVFTLFSLILFNFILLDSKDLARWLIWIGLVFLSLLNDWIVYAGLKFMKRLRLEKKRFNLP